MNVGSYQYFPEYQLFNSLDQLSINKSELWAREENFWLQEEDCHHTWHTCWKTKQPGNLRNVSDLQSCVHQVQGQNSRRKVCSHPLLCLLCGGCRRSVFSTQPQRSESSQRRGAQVLPRLSWLTECICSRSSSNLTAPGPQIGVPFRLPPSNLVLLSRGPC